MALKNGYGGTLFEDAQKTSKHEQVQLFSKDGVEIHVDKGLEKLMLLLWDLNIDTVYSCEGNPEKISKKRKKSKKSTANQFTGYILFDSKKDADYFFNIVEMHIPNDYENYHNDLDDYGSRDSRSECVVRFRREMIPEFEKAFEIFKKDYENFLNDSSAVRLDFNKIVSGSEVNQTDYTDYSFILKTS